MVLILFDIAFTAWEAMFFFLCRVSVLSAKPVIQKSTEIYLV